MPIRFSETIFKKKSLPKTLLIKLSPCSALTRRETTSDFSLLSPTLSAPTTVWDYFFIIQTSPIVTNPTMNLKAYQVFLRVLIPIWAYEGSSINVKVRNDSHLVCPLVTYPDPSVAGEHKRLKNIIITTTWWYWHRVWIIWIHVTLAWEKRPYLGCSHYRNAKLTTTW